MLKPVSITRALSSLIIGVMFWAIAQAALADTFDIEMVLFERYGSGDEVWEADSAVPPLAKAVGDLRSAARSGKARLLSSDSFELGPVTYTLRKKGVRIVEHLRWRQTVPGRGNSDWYRIGDQQLNGLIRMGLGRFLHVDLDLLLNRSDGTSVHAELHRRMRSGELHYIDHPLMGALLQAKPVVVASSAPEQPETGTQPEQAPSETPSEPPEEAPTGPQPGRDIPRATPDLS